MPHPFPLILEMVEGNVTVAGIRWGTMCHVGSPCVEGKSVFPANKPGSMGPLLGLFYGWCSFFLVVSLAMVMTLVSCESVG